MSSMRIYQRMLYVGLGGTGLQIGSQLERALRSELCGPSGTELMDGNFPSQMEPFQLPSCLQFVYFDFDESARAAAKKASSERVADAISEKTTQTVGNLTPTQGSYQKVAQSLRISAIRSVESWLPPSEREPQVQPLSKGAGEMPTAGRAALFEAFRRDNGISTVEGPLAGAIANLNGSDGDLLALAGESALNGFDIFVGFSVAGGTGCGTFYDVIRILSDVCQQNIHGADHSILPLVVMPSAFARKYPEKQRAHRLNGGQALRELFEMVDNQNTGNLNSDVIYPGDSGSSAITRTATTPTAFLFSRPDTVGLDDLHRSIVSFVISNIGTVIGGETEGANARPMMSSLMDEASRVALDAPDGIGQHPAATALAAELRIPTEEIAEILANRLLAQATVQLDKPAVHEENENLFDRFAGASGLDVLISRNPDAQLMTANKQGAKDVTAYLSDRNKEAQKRLRDLHTALQPRVAKLAADFDYINGFQALLGETDIFRAHRVVLGDARFENEVFRGGMIGFIFRRGEVAPENKGFTDLPPQPPALKDKGFGVIKLGLNDPRVVTFLQQQNGWYDWKVKTEWYESWRRQADSWRPQARRMKDRLDAIHNAFVQQKDAEGEAFRTACGGLYRERTGVVYFLPDGRPTNDLDRLYTFELLPRLGEDLRLGEASDAAAIVSKLMSGRWVEAFEATKAGRPEAAMEFTLGVLRAAVRETLSTEHGQPLLPRVQTLLREAAYGTNDHGSDEGASTVTQGRRDQFVNSLSSLIPLDFRPPGIGSLGIDVFYPASQDDAQIEGFLTRTCLDSLSSAQEPRFHALAGIDFVSVVLRRLSQHVTSISEYRDLMRLRAESLVAAKQSDYLPWRQRLGYDPTWIVLRRGVINPKPGEDRPARDERAQILFRLLNLMHDGAVSIGVNDDSTSPGRVEAHQPDNPAAGPIVLELRDLRGGASTWADVVSAYERYVLNADEHGLERCKFLLDYGRPLAADPSELYRTFMGLRASELEKGKKLKEQLTAQGTLIGADPVEFEFWNTIVPRALELIPEAGRSHGQIAADFDTVEVA